MFGLDLGHAVKKKGKKKKLYALYDHVTFKRRVKDWRSIITSNRGMVISLITIM